MPMMLAAVPLLAGVGSAALLPATATILGSTTLAAALPIAMGAFGAISTIAQTQQGQAQKSEADYVAAQDTQAASNAAASGQRALIEQNKETARVESNYAAGAAGSGGTTTDPTANANLAMIGAEGNYRAATAMYEGQSKAQALTNEANTAQLSGTIAQTAANNKAYGTAISSASSLFEKYGSFGNSGNTPTTPFQGPTPTPPFVPYVQPDSGITY